MMVTKVIDLDQQTNSLDDLLTQLDNNTEILLVRGDVPVARITPEKIQPTPEHVERIAGLHQGTTWVADDFDDPLLIHSPPN